MKVKLVLSFLFICGVIVAIFWKRDRNLDLLKTGYSVPAIVTFANHRNYIYQYEVQGKLYTRKKSNFSDGMRVGELYPVYYDPSNPDKNTIEHSMPIIVDSLFDTTKTLQANFEIEKGVHVQYFSYKIEDKIYDRRTYVKSKIDTACRGCTFIVKYKKDDPAIGYLILNW